MLSVKQVARQLAVSSKTVYLLISQGLLKCHRIGSGRGTIRVSRQQLDEYLARSETTRELPRTVPLRHLKA